MDEIYLSTGEVQGEHRGEEGTGGERSRHPIYKKPTDVKNTKRFNTQLQKKMK